MPSLCRSNMDFSWIPSASQKRVSLRFPAYIRSDRRNYIDQNTSNQTVQELRKIVVTIVWAWGRGCNHCGALPASFFDCAYAGLDEFVRTEYSLTYEFDNGHPLVIQVLIASKFQRTALPNRIGAGRCPALRSRHRVRVDICSIFATSVAVTRIGPMEFVSRRISELITSVRSLL